MENSFVIQRELFRQYLDRLASRKQQLAHWQELIYEAYQYDGLGDARLYQNAMRQLEILQNTCQKEQDGLNHFWERYEEARLHIIESIDKAEERALRLFE